MRTTPSVVRVNVTDSPVVHAQKPRKKRSALSARRQAIGWTQANLAEVLEVAPNTISRWETGVSIPQPSIRDLLAEKLKVSVLDLSKLIKGDSLDERASPRRAPLSCRATSDIPKGPRTRNRRYQRAPRLFRARIAMAEIVTPRLAPRKRSSASIRGVKCKD